MQRCRFIRFTFTAMIVGAAALPIGYCLGQARAVTTSEKPFLDANDSAMNTMMSGMAIHASGNIDVDFAAMMIPHHQGAIDMAKAELQYGGNEQLRRIAQEIIIDQQQEITAMQLAVKSIKPNPSQSR
jgi:uncharacterized protein (DUF305 family)